MNSLKTLLSAAAVEWAERNEDYLNQGTAIFVTDMPGTGQAPILGSETAERMARRRRA